MTVEFLIDWPRGRRGYLPAWHKDREFGVCDKRHRRGARRYRMRVDLGANWFDAEDKARWDAGKDAFELFLDGMISSAVHEVVHQSQPKYMRDANAERQAAAFELAGPWARRRGA